MRAKELGATPLLEHMPIPGIGAFSMLRDPAGATVRAVPTAARLTRDDLDRRCSLDSPQSLSRSLPTLSRRTHDAARRENTNAILLRRASRVSVRAMPTFGLT